MKIRTAFVIACLASAASAAEPQWRWIEVENIADGSFRTEQGKAEVTRAKGRLHITFLDEEARPLGQTYQGTLGPPRDPPRFKSVTSFDIAGTLRVEGTDYGGGPMRGSYLRNTYSGKTRAEMNLTCSESIVLSDGDNTISLNRGVDSQHAC